MVTCEGWDYTLRTKGRVRHDEMCYCAYHADVVERGLEAIKWETEAIRKLVQGPKQPGWVP